MPRGQNLIRWLILGERLLLFWPSPRTHEAKWSIFSGSLGSHTSNVVQSHQFSTSFALQQLFM